MSTSITSESVVIFGNGTFQVYISKEQLSITAVGTNESEAIKIKARDNAQQQRMLQVMLIAMMRLDWNSEYSYESAYAYEDAMINYPELTPQNVKAAFEALAEKPESQELIRNLRSELKTKSDLLKLATKMQEINDDES